MARGEEQIQTQGAPGLLIVDDERSLRFSLGEWARDTGFKPLEAATGREALAAIETSIRMCQAIMNAAHVHVYANAIAKNVRSCRPPATRERVARHS